MNRRRILLAMLVYALVMVLAGHQAAFAEARVEHKGITQYAQFLQTLVSSNGYAEQKSTTVKPSTDYERIKWYTSKGILSAAEADLDGDGALELVVISVSDGGASGKQMYCTVYKSSNGQVSTVGSVMIEDMFAFERVNMDVYLVKSGSQTYIYLQRFGYYENSWGGYYLFSLKNGKIGLACGLRDGAWTATINLDLMSTYSSFSTINTVYNTSVKGTSLYWENGRGEKNGKYSSYNKAVVAELKPYGLTSFQSNAYCPLAKETSNMTQLCRTRGSYDEKKLTNSYSIKDYTGLNGSGSSDDPADAVTKITLNKTSATIEAGKTITLNAMISPKKAAAAKITWSSDNGAVATVTQDGVVTGVSKGSTYIRARTANGKQVKCSLTVKARPKKYFAVVVAESDIGATGEGSSVQKDMYAMYEMLRRLNFNGQRYDIVYELNPSGDGIEQLINEQIEKMEKTDTLLFYISSHGWHGGSMTLADDTSLSAAELKRMLDKHTGPKVLLMDSCFSGAVVGKSATGETMAFNQEMARLFGSAIGAKGTGTEGDGDLPSNGEFRASGYTVITACSSNEFSHAQAGKYGYFTKALCEAGGWNMKSSKKIDFKAAKGSQATLAQVYKYIKSKVKSYWIPSKLMYETQSVQCYGNTDTVLFRR